jgi:hypothetical protein
MKFPTKSMGAALLGALCILAPTQAHAGEEFRIQNCSNHKFSVDIAIADWFKPSIEQLGRHESVTMHCMTSKCNLGVTWAGLNDMGESFEHLYTDLEHGHYVLQMKTGHASKSGTPSSYCIKTYAMKKGDNCDVFDADPTEYKQKLGNMIGHILPCD